MPPKSNAAFQAPTPTLEPESFTRYQKGVVTILAFLQFTIILDFMILSPLGAILMPALSLTTSQFGLVVSVYAFSAGISGLLAAGFADRFDRKKLLLFFYAGFVLGTLFCGLANTYHSLLLARMVTGLFGGVIGSIVFAITTDLFAMKMRGRVMGFIQTAFAGSQVLGIPLGLYLSNYFNWHAPFLMIVAASTMAGAFIFFYLRPIDGHLTGGTDRNAFHHFFETLTRPSYVAAYLATALLSTGGFMMMPFSSAFSVNNLGIGLGKLPMVYMITGLFSILSGPLVGRLSDRLGKYRIFCIGSAISIATILFYTNRGITPMWGVIAISAVMFVGISSRMIASSALMSAVPEQTHRGSFMSVNSSIQQISGGIAAGVAGHIVVQTAQGPLQHFDRLGYVVVGSIAVTVVMMYRINREVSAKS